MMLMCKNTPVYDIENEKTLNYNLLPGLMQQKGADNHTFTKWMKYRYSSGTNTIARKLKGITFGQGARMRINRETRALSFSDCYWIKAEDDSICFEEISPYYKPFWDGNEEFTGQAAPTLYVGGALSKEWKQDGKLYKYGDISVELQCIKLCRECGISVERADETDGGIAISNITSPKVMLEQADQSGRIDPDDFDEQTIIDLFGKAGAQMLIIDAIIGNGDRHAGNFGWIRNTDTGEYGKQLVPDTINNGRDRHRTKNYAAFSTSNFQICRICGKSRSISQCFSLFLGLLGSLTTTRPSESMPVRTMKCPL